MSRTVVERVTKRYDELVAVDAFELTVEEGDFVALLGPSGCGKTTSLHMLAGLERPTEGRILIGGDDVTDLPARRRNVGLIFQDYSIFPHLSPRQNIEFGLRVRQWSRERRREKVREVVDIVELAEEVLERRVSDLSPSELQRVAIARTLVTEPRLVLLDEPLSNLEPELRARTRARLKRLFEDLGQTTIYVTHDQIEAMALANRIAVMSAGRLQQVGTPEDVYLRPANVFVAGFLGSPPMNFLSGRLEDTNGTLAVSTAGGAVGLQARRDDLAAGGADVVVGIRPEHLTVSRGADAAAAAAPQTLSGTVFEVEPLGLETIVSVMIGGTVVKVIADADADYELDAPVHVGVSLDHVCLFDETTATSRMTATRW